MVIPYLLLWRTINSSGSKSKYFQLFFSSQINSSQRQKVFQVLVLIDGARDHIPASAEKWNRDYLLGKKLFKPESKIAHVGNDVVKLLGCIKCSYIPQDYLSELAKKLLHCDRNNESSYNFSCHDSASDSYCKTSSPSAHFRI